MIKGRRTMLFAVALLSLCVVRPICAQSNKLATLYYFPPANGAPNSYTNSNGVEPVSGIILSGNTLYGATRMGGSAGEGTLFRINIDGSGFTNLHTFTAGSLGVAGPTDYTNSDGVVPVTGMIISGNTLHGTATDGGSGGTGTIFQLNTDSSDFTNIYYFTALNVFSTNSDGCNPGGLILSGNTLYGTAGGGGLFGEGTVFMMNTNGSEFTVLHNFSALDPSTRTNDDGGSPGGLILSGNALYGATEYGGTSGLGTVFRVNTDGSGFTNLYNFTNGTDGGSSLAGVAVISGDILYGTTYFAGTVGNGAVFSITTDGSDFTNLHSFSATSIEGANPEGLKLSGNTLIGTAANGGSFGYGTVFMMNTNGSGFTVLHNFSALARPTYTNNDGAGPDGLILSGNILYGTASGGGSGGSGTVFALNLTVPTLAIALTGNQVVISWPVAAANYVLQTATNLATGSWSNLTNGIFIDGTNYILTTNINNRTAFFQLQQQ
jgi:uncharacterized repeat protein (TIGR03803 family)